MTPKKGSLIPTLDNVPYRSHGAPGRIRIFDGQKPTSEPHEAIKETVCDPMKRKEML
jgi:hypothetical protein